jgi:hypothetical protein
MIPLIRVEVSLTRKLTKAEELLAQLPNRLANLRPLMQNVIAPEVNNMLLKWWNSKGRAYGRGGWPEWAEATLAKRTRKGNVSKGILRDTDHLFKTLFRARSADSRLRLVPGGIRLALNVGVRYAIFHQLGTENMPARQVIPDPLPGVFIKRIRSLVKEFILTGKAA